MKRNVSSTFFKKEELELIRTTRKAMRAADHPLRQNIMSLLRKTKQTTVTDIYSKLRLEQSVASQHLAILRQAGLVSTKRDGREIYYSVNEDAVKHLLETCASLELQALTRA